MTIQPRGFDFLKDVDVRLSVELGRTDMTLRHVLALGEDSVVILDRLTDELLDVMVNGTPIAKGEVVSENGRFGLRIVELLGSPPPVTQGGAS
jgi:flagellar motor switch protein FliN/FliY